MFEIIPSPGTENKSFSEIERKIESVKSFAKTIHIDVCDGKFAPNHTFDDPQPFKEFIKQMATQRSGWVSEDQGIIFEIHLMVEEPINYIEKWADVGFTRFIGQIEKMSSQEEFIAKAQLFGEAGLAVDGPTPLDEVKVSYDDLDSILFFIANKAGYSGQSFQEDRLDKVKALRSINEFLPVEVDGGINDETIAIAKAAGVNRFVATSFLFNFDTPENQFNLLKQKLQEFSPTAK